MDSSYIYHALIIHVSLQNPVPCIYPHDPPYYMPSKMCTHLIKKKNEKNDYKKKKDKQKKRTKKKYKHNPIIMITIIIKHP